MDRNLGLASLLLLGALGSVGCGAADPTVPDGGDIITHPDAGLPDAGNSGPVGCTTVTSWPSSAEVGEYDTSDPPNTIAFAFQTSAVVLAIQDFHVGTTYPKTVTFSTRDSYAQCDVCLLLSTGCAASGSCDAVYFQQGGSATITHADAVEAAGTLVASASNVLLQEWDLAHDAPVASGSCYQIDQASWNVSWSGN